MNKSISKKTWSSIILFGIFGQIAWTVENMYFNVFLFNEIGGTTKDIALMVALSATTATIATLLVGAYSDKINRRKGFISFGYILWGISTLVFAFISRENTSNIFNNLSTQRVAAITIMFVIIMDCVMTFFGSSANDAAFNAWITDITVPENRGKVEGVLSAFPLLSMLIVAGGFGIVIDLLGFPVFFISLGLLVTLTGFAGLFLIKESRSCIKTDEKYFKNVFYGFRLSVVKENKYLYLAFFTMAIYGISSQIILPYLIVYMEWYLKLSVAEYSVVLAFAILGAATFGIIIGRVVDKRGKSKLMYLSACIYIVGLFLMYFMRNFILIAVVGTVMMSGFVLILIILNAIIRDNTPREKVGLFQGIRMIFFVLLPMIIGPFIGNMVINQSNQTYVNAYNEVVNIPTPEIFLAAAILALFMFIPMYKLNKRIKIVEMEEYKCIG